MRSPCAVVPKVVTEGKGSDVVPKGGPVGVGPGAGAVWACPPNGIEYSAVPEVRLYTRDGGGCSPPRPLGLCWAKCSLKSRRKPKYRRNSRSLGCRGGSLAAAEGGGAVCRRDLPFELNVMDSRRSAKRSL